MFCDLALEIDRDDTKKMEQRAFHPTAAEAFFNDFAQFTAHVMGIEWDWVEFQDQVPSREQCF